jgi:hypothetical protein
METDRPASGPFGDGDTPDRKMPAADLSEAATQPGGHDAPAGGSGSSGGAAPTMELAPVRTAAVAVAERPQPERQARRRWLTRKRLLIGIGALVAVLVVVGAVAYNMFAAQINGLLAARDFCTAVQHQDYAKAYSYFAPQLRKQVPEDAFTTISRNGDDLQGRVVDCTASGVDVAIAGQSVVVHSVITRSIVGKQKNDVHLALVNGAWKISSSPDPLLLPMTSAYEFCENLKAQRYPDAYAYLSDTLQKQVSREAFVTILTGSDGLYGKVTACNVAKVTLSRDQSSVAVQSTVVRTKVTQPSELHLALTSAGWRVSSSPDPLLLPLATAFDFCGDLKAQKYATAYAYFTSDMQRQVPADAFATILQGSDGLYGRVQACNVTGVDANQDDSVVVVHATIVRDKSQTLSDLHLAYLGDHWQITQSPDPLLLPLTTAYEFCADLKRQQYPGAYGYLAPQVQGQVPQDAFVYILQGADGLYGKVTACDVGSVETADNGATVIVHSTLVRTRQSQASDVYVGSSGDAWKITRSPDPLLVPLTTAYEFCQDLRSQAYATAYGYLGSGVQGQVPSDAFAYILQGADGLYGKVTGCTVSAVEVTNGGGDILVHSTLQRTGQSQASVLHLAVQSAVWKIVDSPDPLLVPLTAAYEFCQDLKAQQYGPGYGYLAPNLQGQVSPDAFVYILNSADTLYGRVTACNVTGVQMSGDGAAVAVQNTLVRAGSGGSQPGTVHLALGGGQWRIDQPPDPLLLPATTAYNFCQALKADNFTNAFNLMSAAARQKIGSPVSLQVLFGVSEGLTGKLTDCQVTAVTWGADHKSLTLNSTLSFQKAQPMPGTVNLVLDTDGTWRVDKFTVLLYGVIPVAVPSS